MNIVKITFAAAVLAQQVPVAADSKNDSVEPDVKEELTALVEACIDAEVQGDRSTLESRTIGKAAKVLRHVKRVDRLFRFRRLYSV